jgi:hypothetical protein
VETVVRLPGRVGLRRSVEAEVARLERETLSDTMPDVLRKCSDIIASTIADRIREFGGTENDVRQIARSAAYAVFVWSAGETLGG